MRRVLLLVLLTAPLVQAPYGAKSFWTSDEGRPSVSFTHSTGQQAVAGIASFVAAAVVTGAVASSGKKSLYTSAGGRSTARTNCNDEPSSSSIANTSYQNFRVPQPWNPDDACEDCVQSEPSESSGSNEDCDSASEGSDDGGDNGSAVATPTPKFAAAKLWKLWSNAQFPEGTRPLQANWDLANLTAAQEWDCPCTDRRNCIGAERGINALHLYEHRKQFLTTCQMRGGMRNAFRSELSARFSSMSRTFSRSFVVGPLNDCCAASAGLAAGLSVQTYQTRMQRVQPELATWVQVGLWDWHSALQC